MSTATETIGELGLIRGESSEVYHAQDAVSASKLRTFARKPGGAQLYHQKYVAKTLEREESDAMRFGSALHCAVLEPEKLSERYCTRPAGIDRRTTAGKIAYAQFEAANQGKTILDADDAKLIVTISNQIRAHKTAAQLLAAGESEVGFRVQSALENLPVLQCRTDWINLDGCELTEGRPYVLDIKTTATLEEDAFGNFQRSFEEHAYHRQAALYMSIVRYAIDIGIRDFWFVAAEKCAPFGVQVKRLSDRALDRGKVETAQLLSDLDECYRLNWWPNTSQDPGEIDLSPRYYARSKEQIDNLWG